MGSGISNITKTATGINVGGIFDALKLLGLGIGANAVFENLDEIKEGANNLKKKVDSWFGNNKGKLIKDLDEEYVKSFIDSEVYKLNKVLRHVEETIEIGAKIVKLEQQVQLLATELGKTQDRLKKIEILNGK